MAFNPDEYLNETGTSSTATAEFDPDAYLKEAEEPAATFDPDAYLAEESPLAGLEIPPAPETPKFEARKPQEGALRKAADVPVRFLAGTTGVLKTVADVFGADSPASQQFEERQKFWNSLVSESGKEKDKRAAEIQKAAEDKGVWEQAKAAGRAFLESPTSMIATGAGSLAPFIAASAAGAAIKGGAAAVKGAQIAFGTVSGAGAVKGRIYEEVKQAAIDAGKSEEEAEALAVEAQSYSENPEQIAAGGALGALASAVGIEATAGRAIAGAARKAATGAQIIGRNIGEEVITEVPQQAQEATAKNIALQKAGFDVPTFRGVAGEATTAGIVAAALGGVAGGIDAVAASSENAQKVKLAVNTQSAAQQVTDVAPLTATAVMDQAEETGRQAAANLQTEADQAIESIERGETISVPATVGPLAIREGETQEQYQARIEALAAETPEQRVARLQREAQEAAGEIELEEEPSVSGLPPVEPTPPVTPTPEAAVAPIEPVVPAEGAVEPAVTEVAPEVKSVRQFKLADVEAPTNIEGWRALRNERIAAERKLLQEEIGLTPEQAEGLHEIYIVRNSDNTERWVRRNLTPEQVERFEAFDEGPFNARGGPVEFLEYDSDFNPEFLDVENDAPSLANAIVQAFAKGKPEQGLNDKWIYAVGAIQKLEAIGGSRQDISDALTQQARRVAGSEGDAEFWYRERGREINETIEAFAPNMPAERGAAPAAVAPTPELPAPVTPEAAVAPVTPEVAPAIPQLEPLRRVARAEQTEEDVAGLVDSGFVEVYNGQPVITQAGLEALPEAERPRLTPEARKIQIDTRTSEAAAEAISKNLRIGVDQVPVDVRMPAGWTLVGDVYVPPTRMERIVPSDIETVPVAEEAADVFANVSKVVAPRLPESNPETASSQEIAEVVSKYQTSEPTAKMILANTNFEAKEVGVLPEGWAIENIDGQDIALSPIWQKSRRDLQVEIRKLTAIERGALSARLAKEGWINEDQAKEYLRNAIARSSQEQVTASEAEANERFDSLVEGIIRENRASVSSVVGEIPKPTFDLEAEERARSAKPPISPSRVLDPNEIEFMSARQALKLLAEANIVHRGYQGFEGTGDADAQGNALWRTTGNVDKPRYALIQEAASILSKTNLRILDAERINISGRPSGRAYRAWEGHVYVPRTSDGETLFVEPWILVHEIGHTLTIDALRKYVVQREATGEAYYKRLKNALADKNTPREVKRAVKLYIDTIKALNLEKEYFKKNGLAGDGDRGIRNASARDVKKIINPFTGKQITTDDMYALADIHEFYAQAWNAESFQDILKQIKVEPQRSAFQKFVDIIKDILGFESDTMAYAVIDASLRLASLEAGNPDIKQTIKRTEGLRTIKELPRSKLTWSNTYSTRRYPEYVSDGVKMARNKFTKLGYDQIKFRIKKSGLEEWTVFAEVSESYKKSKPSNAYLQNQTIFTLTLSNKASVQEVAERLSSDINGLINEKYLPLMKAFRKQKSAPSPPQAPPTEAEPAPEPEGETPAFTEGTPEAATLKEMEASMAKVDAASEAKGGKPETQKISNIAANWMDQGGDERALQDAIVENTNLTPANAAKVAKAIARQYDIQQSIASAFLETPTGLSVEAIPEGATLPPEVDPDRPKPVMVRLFETYMGVKVPPTKLTVNEKTALRDQIRLKAAANREAKKAQQATQSEVIDIIKAMELRGPVRPKQAAALAKRAAKVIWTSEKSMEAFVNYAEKVVINTNYDADLREAKAAQKRAQQLSNSEKVAAPQREVLADIAKIGVNMLDNPAEFAVAVNHYLRGFKSVVSPDYVVIPDAEITSYLSAMQTEADANKAEFDRATNERLAIKYGIPLNELEKYLNAENIIRDLASYARREVVEGILTEKAQETLAGLKAYDQTQLRDEQRKILDEMVKVDPRNLDSEERQRFVRIGNNIIFNNQTNGAEYFVATAKGQQMAREMAKDETAIAKNKAWVNLLPSIVSPKLQRGWALELQSVADTFRNAFGKGAMGKVYRMMGMLDLNMAQTKANTQLDQIQEEISAFYNGLEKKYKAAARNQDGILAEGVVGFLIQKVPEKGETESLAQRRNLIQQDIRNRREDGDQDRAEMANRIEALLQQLDGATVQDILNNLKQNYRPNYDSLMFLKDTLFPKYKEFLKRFDENFNDQANNYENPDYLPIGFVLAGPSLAITEEETGQFYDHVSLRPKQSSYTIKRADYTQLPTDQSTGTPKEIEFNLRRNAFDSLSDQITKAYTNPAWQRINAFLKTPESIEVFGGRANRDFFIERLNRLRLSRMRRGALSRGYIEKTADVVSVIARKLGTGIALGGVYQTFKQAPDQLITTLATTGRRDLLGKNVVDVLAQQLAPRTLKESTKMLNKFSIGRRGDASAGYKYINQMEGAQTRMERYFTESNWDKAKEQGSKIADIWMVALKKSDFVAAAGSWLTYYRADLAKRGIKFEGWEREAELVDTDPARQDAAAYAEQMTDIYQGSSDPTQMATFAQSGKSGWENLWKSMFVPFNSFAVQQRMRLYSDARDALTKTGVDQKTGYLGLSGTIGGMILFHMVKRLFIPTLSGLGVGVLYGVMGVDVEEPDEEKKKEDLNKRWRQMQGEILANMLVGGTGQIIEAKTIDAFNYAAYLISVQTENESVLDDNGEVMPFSTYVKERSPFWRYQSFDSAYSLGMLEIGLGQAEKAVTQSKMLMDSEEMENFTPEEQRLLYFAAVSEWLYTMRLNDADFARLVDKARRDMIKAVKDREKELQRIRSGR